MSDTQNQLNNLYGQLAALEHLVLALLVEHPNKGAVQAEFLRQTEENATHDLYSTRPESFQKRVCHAPKDTGGSFGGACIQPS